MPEITDTTKPFQLTPEGTYEFTVKELPLKKLTQKGDKTYFEFKFTYVLDNSRKTHVEFFFPWDLPPLLLALGFQESEKDKFVWERQECIGKTIKATIQHRSDKKDPIKIRSKMIDITLSVNPGKADEDIPF